MKGDLLEMNEGMESQVNYFLKISNIRITVKGPVRHNW
jgi:hypothetical protein